MAGSLPRSNGGCACWPRSSRGMEPARLSGSVLKPGTRLLREWGGKTDTVIVLEDRFDYDGKRYQSLTEITPRITGAHWSGPRFFGLRKAAVQT